MRWFPAVIAAFLLTPAAASSQQQDLSGGGSGIWIADASGRLRPVEPVATSFLRQSSPARQTGAVRVVLAVESFAHSGNGALASTELAVTRILAALAGIGIQPAEITREAAPVVQIEYERPRLLAGSWEEPRVVGFRAGLVLGVRVAEPHALGLVIDFATGAGATRVLAIEAQP